MKQLTEAWFSFGGKKCTDMGVILMEMPSRPSFARRGEAFVPPGRDGDVWIPEDALETAQISVPCTSEDGFNAEAVRAWLSGEAWLVFSDMPDRALRARAADGWDMKNLFLRFDKKKFEAPFVVQPYYYLYPEKETQTFTASGAYINNPGTAHSAPRIAITGSGDFTVTLNAQLMQFSGVSGGIIVDSELMDCLNADGITLANHLAMMDDFPLLQPGDNLISWTGNVTKVTITPRWRYV